MGNQVLYPHMHNFAYGDRRMHMGIPICKRAGIAKKFAYGDPRTHNEIVCIRGLTYTDDVAASAIGSEPDPFFGRTSANNAVTKLTRSALTISILAKNGSSKNNSAYSVDAVKGM